MRFRATRGSWKVCSINPLWLSREPPLDSGDEIQSGRGIAVNFLVTPVKRIAQIAVHCHARPEVVIQIHPQVGEAGVGEKTGEGAEAGFDVQRLSAKPGADIRREPLVEIER